jgi:hypothetical protein
LLRVDSVIEYLPPGCIVTRSARIVSITDPKPEDIYLDDIVYALSQINRFTGHTKRPYSVLEHVMHGYNFARIVYKEKFTPEISLQWLLHDASEAYLGDVSRPLKHRLANYHDLEDRFNTVIISKFNCPLEFDPLVTEIDNRMLATEFRDLHRSNSIHWRAMVPQGCRPFPQLILKKVNGLAVYAMRDAIRKMFKEAFRRRIWAGPV